MLNNHILFLCFFLSFPFFMLYFVTAVFKGSTEMKLLFQLFINLLSRSFVFQHVKLHNYCYYRFFLLVDFSIFHYYHFILLNVRSTLTKYILLNNPIIIIVLLQADCTTGSISQLQTCSQTIWPWFILKRSNPHICGFLKEEITDTQ